KESSNIFSQSIAFAIIGYEAKERCNQFTYDAILKGDELDRMEEKLELCIIKKEKEYAVLWNNCASNTLDPLNQKLETNIVELEFQVVNYEREISHLKTTYKNLYDSITSNRAHAKPHNLIYENAKLRARLFENTSESMNITSGTSVTPQ
nr:hypothetical protein [Tanacetum cinerariifolium]